MLRSFLLPVLPLFSHFLSLLLCTRESLELCRASAPSLIRRGPAVPSRDPPVRSIPAVPPESSAHRSCAKFPCTAPLLALLPERASEESAPVDRVPPRRANGPVSHTVHGLAARRPSPAKAHLPIRPAASSSTHRAKPMGELTPGPLLFFLLLGQFSFSPLCFFSYPAILVIIQMLHVLQKSP